MTGQQHYEAAEKLLASCRLMAGRGEDADSYPAFEHGLNTIGNALAAAQVHATLAVAHFTEYVASAAEIAVAES